MAVLGHVIVLNYAVITRETAFIKFVFEPVSTFILL